MTNLRRIKKGDTYVWELKFWQDADKTIPMDVTGHSFAFSGVNVAGTTVITLNNAAFVEQAAVNHRKVTLPAGTTTTYAVGELRYQLDVTLPDSTVETWMEGYVNIEP